MSKKSFRPGGVNPALVTPFARDQSVDEEAFRALIRHVINDVDGLVPCGTTGEFNYLNPEEHKRLVQITVEESLLVNCHMRCGWEEEIITHWQ